jgi:heat shock protein HslJ
MPQFPMPKQTQTERNRTMRRTRTLLLLAMTLLTLLGALPAQANSPALAPRQLDPIDLAGTQWMLVSLDGALPMLTAPISLEFAPRGNVASGNDGCNNFSTTYTQDGAKLTFEMPMAGTLMACPDAVSEQAANFADALAATQRFFASERQLVLLSEGNILATFVAAAQGLAGSSWEVLNYNNGREAVVGLIEGSEISLDFGDEDLHGNAGCNLYFAEYSLDSNQIAIGAIGQTFRICELPPGIMEQESDYLRALESAATWSLRGRLLEFRTADDALAVVMTRKAPIDLPAPTPAPEVASGVVVGANVLNVRSGPSTAYPVVGVAREGDSGEIVGRSVDGRWWATPVQSAPEGLGWVSADFILATNTENVPVIFVAPPPAPTPVPPTPTRAPLPTPTRGAAPSPTPMPLISFWVTPQSINQGQCAILSWSVENVQAVWVYPQGQPYSLYPRTGQGSEQVCPNRTTTYEMRVLLRDGSTQFRQVTLNVTGAPPTATPVPPPPTPTAAVNPLAGTRWAVNSLNNGNQAVVTLISGTSIDMEFTVDGRVQGNSGCNSYSGPYSVSGDTISIGALTGTQMLCDQPTGVMEQEQQFLAALQQSRTWRIDGSTLTLRDGSGAMTVVANR